MHAFEEIKALKKHLEEENIQLRQEIEARYPPKEIVGAPVHKKGPQFGRKGCKKGYLRSHHGGTGTGKEILARVINNMNPRRGHSI